MEKLIESWHEKGKIKHYDVTNILSLKDPASHYSTKIKSWGGKIAKNGRSFQMPVDVPIPVTETPEYKVLMDTIYRMEKVDVLTRRVISDKDGTHHHCFNINREFAEDIKKHLDTIHSRKEAGG